MGNKKSKLDNSTSVDTVDIKSILKHTSFHGVGSNLSILYRVLVLLNVSMVKT